MAGRSLVRRAAAAGAGALPPALRGSLFRTFGPRVGVRGSELGLLTLVLVYEAVDEPRLADTLASIRAQSHGFREVLLAPVGAAAATMTRHTLRSHRDPRLRALPPAATWQEAANRGADAAAGRFLGFLRGCDPLPSGALHHLVAALAGSGSDVATGTVVQRGQPEEWLVRAQLSSHARPGTALRPAERPELAGDLVVGNKLVRTEAWRSLGLRFSEQDDWLVAPIIARLLAGTRRVDVLDGPVHEHLHEHGTRPFGAMPSPLAELSAWRTRAGHVERALAGSPLAAGWWEHVLDVALPRFLKDTERATDEQWQALRALVATYHQRAGGPNPLAVRAESRTLLWLAAQDRRDEVAALAAEAFDLGAELRTTVAGSDLVAEWSAAPPDVPADARRLSVAETQLVTEVRRHRAGDDGCDLDLFVRVGHLDLSMVEHRVEATSEGGTALPVEVLDDPAATRWARTRFQTATAVRVRVPTGTTTIELSLTAGALRRSRTVEVVDPVVRDPEADRSVVVRDLALHGTDLLLTVDGRAADVRLVDEADRTVQSADADDAGRVRLPLSQDRFGRTSWLPTGHYRVVTGLGNPTVAEDLLGRLPLEQVGSRHRLHSHVGPFGGLVVRLGPPLADDEAGPYAQERLIETYAEDRDPVEPDLFYFESYAGRSATDSPLAIFDELRRRRPDLTAYWGIADHGQWTPDGATPLLLRSRAWYDVLARAGCVVVNTDVEPWFRRRPGQFVLQTFHGYPSKGMGEGQWLAKHLPPSQIAQLRARGVDTWSAILTPTPEMTRHYRQQYGYDGVAFEHGYPRDDDLTGPDTGARRAAARELLGIRADQTAVLYAPTWREHLATRPRGAEMANLLDVEAAARALGERYVLLLRGHRFHAPEPRGTHVVDVTSYPEVNDLILASDVAVLDYSSLRFDFALTGNPMVFLVPDLDEYGEGTRSFLFPFGDSAPGPFVDDTDGVVAELRDVSGLRARCAAEIARFNETYHPHQDGRAAERVVDQLLAGLGC